MSATVHVENISPQTSEKEIRDFFSFCGKIASLSVTPVSGSQSATVTFEKPTAAKTALLLDNTQLGPAQVHVTSAASLDELAGRKSPDAAGDDDDVRQEDKPRARIFAEYLAQGYVISDRVIEKGIALDREHGITERFRKTLQDLDHRFHATKRAQAADERYGVTNKGTAAWQGLTSYFEKALGTPTGQKVRKFYEDTNKQVMDVHNEAKHLASLKTGKPEGGAAAATTSTAGDVAPGSDIEKAGLEQVPGSDRTKCNCGANAAGCPCPPGKCACSNCAKNPEAPAGAATTSEKV